MPGPLNVLWIQTDELRADALGCYGHSRWPKGLTPNLDALAARGVLFTNTFCNSPVCVSSRSSLLTGRYPHEIGVFHNEAVNKDHFQRLGLTTFPQVFAQAGYETVNAGKIHTPRNATWQCNLPLPKYDNPFLSRVVRQGCAPEQMVCLAGTPFLVVGGVLDSEQTPTVELTDTAIEWLQSKRDGAVPWLFRVSYEAPHTPVIAPRRFFEKFDPRDFKFDSQFDITTDLNGPLEQFIAEANKSDEIDPQDIAFARACYWAVVAHLDEQIGRLLDCLDALDLTTRTIIVFDSDHGTLLGEQGSWQKQQFHRAAHRVPQIISCPGVLPENVQRDDLNDLLDRAPTLMKLCGISRPSQFRGRDLFADAQSPKDRTTFGIIGYGELNSYLYPLIKCGPPTPRRACVRTRQWRYDVSVRWKGRDLFPGNPDYAPCLINSANDPEERINLSGRAEYAAVESHMASLLEGFLSLPVYSSAYCTTGGNPCS